MFFPVFFENSEDLIVEFSENITVIEGDDIPYYEGTTDITPKVNSDILLETAGTQLTTDINVRKVPVFKTSNTSGITVYIGGDE